MTEEVIIDGVDVSECCFYNNSKCDNPNGMACNCINNAVCYFKELKRLEQERDEWKKKYEDAANENLKEIYELIKKNDCWRGIVNVVCSKLEQENKELKEQAQLDGECIDKLIEARDMYAKALEEIKNNFMCFRSCMIPFHIGDKDNLPHKMADAIQNYCESIINKINEVLND